MKCDYQYKTLNAEWFVPGAVTLSGAFLFIMLSVILSDVVRLTVVG
jgi:hypothetical protein